ncbi:MAG: hypothetical protein RIC55_07260 [Pirellulaceae bacterium]
MYRFHIAIHARPVEAGDGDPREIDGRGVRPLNVTAGEVTDPLGVTFDEAVRRLEALPRFYLELDGSFLWTAPQGPKGWQTEGVLYDGGERLHYVEMKGSCPAEQFNALLASFGWPETPLAFQLMRQAVFLGEDAFREFAQEG